MNTINPKHYKGTNGSDVTAFCIEHDLNFCKGNVLKYVVRAGRKDKTKKEEDLLKAVEYTRRESTQPNIPKYLPEKDILRSTLSFCKDQQLSSARVCIVVMLMTAGMYSRYFNDLQDIIKAIEVEIENTKH